MTGEIIPMKDVSQLPAELANKFGDTAEDLISGSGGFPVLAIRGSKWRVKTGGEEHPLKDADDNPVPTVDLVVIRAVEGLSKNYYEGEYKEGDDSPPDCYSIDGAAPDATVDKPQSATCAACPHNVWGSKITPQGTKTKRCSDSKILAVTFSSDLHNEAIGGPMLLRVPAASLKDLTKFGKAVKSQHGLVVQQIAVRLGFDLDASYPKLTFRPVRALSQDEVNTIGELYDSEQVSNIVHAGEFTQTAPAKPKEEAVSTDFVGDEQAAPSIGAPVEAKAEEKPAPEPAPKEPETAEEVPATADADLDNILSGL